MRSDMARVTVERPRIPDHSGRKGRPLPLEDLPAHEGLRRRHILHGDGKTLNENLTPLRRYLERQVGRPWDKVYAEIAAHLRVDSTVQQHVRDHLRDFVSVQPRRVRSWWHSCALLWYQPLYVDPVTNLLCRTDCLPEEKARLLARQQRRPTPPTRVPLAADRELRLIDGLWYEIQLAVLPEAEYRPYPEIKNLRLKRYGPSRVVEIAVLTRRLITPAVRDVVTGALIEAGPAIDDPAGWNAYRRAHPDCRYATAKRMLNRQELRRHSLVNDASP